MKCVFSLGTRTGLRLKLLENREAAKKEIAALTEHIKPEAMRTRIARQKARARIHVLDYSSRTIVR